MIPIPNVVKWVFCPFTPLEINKGQVNRYVDAIGHFGRKCQDVRFVERCSEFYKAGNLIIRQDPAADPVFKWWLAHFGLNFLNCGLISDCYLGSAFNLKRWSFASVLDVKLQLYWLSGNDLASNQIHFCGFQVGSFANAQSLLGVFKSIPHRLPLLSANVGLHEHRRENKQVQGPAYENDPEVLRVSQLVANSPEKPEAESQQSDDIHTKPPFWVGAAIAIGVVIFCLIFWHILDRHDRNIVAFILIGVGVVGLIAYSKQRSQLASFGVRDTLSIAGTKHPNCGGSFEKSAAVTQAFVADVATRIKNKPQISTDGFAKYVAAVKGSFGADADYGQIVKTYGGEPQRYNFRNAQQMCFVRKELVSGNPDPKLVSTSYIERANATTRLHMKRLARLTHCFSKKFENFEAAVALHFAYYNLVRTHGTLKCTPAMAAGVERSFWTVGDLVEAAQ